jgi:hypothetical protein
MSAIEDDGLVVVYDNAVLAMPGHHAGQDCSFDVGADAHQVIDRMGVIDTHHVLFDDLPLVEHLGDVVGGRSDQLDPAFTRAICRGMRRRRPAGTSDEC